MTPPTEDLPPADKDRERHAIELFPHRTMSPEEYAARHAHLWACFSFDNFRYSDPDLDRWVQRLGDIFFGRAGAPSVDELRARYLTAEERSAVLKDLDDGSF